METESIIGCVSHDQGPSSDAGLLPLLFQLRASIESVQAATVSLNLPALRRLTNEQVQLARQIALHLAPSPQTFEAASHIVSRQEIKEAAIGVIAAARLQSTLLARMQRKLSVIANLQTGPVTAYSADRATFPIQSSTHKGLPPCRA